MFITLALSPAATNAQDIDCSDMGNLPQQPMNYCAYLDYQNADADLNDTYKIVRKQLQDQDQYISEDEIKSADSLRDAQRAWITYRDKACETEGFMFRGGSLEPFIVSSCKARLTRRRTEDIRAVFEIN